MAVMASLDIVLDEYKLSDPQKNAVIELLSDGFTTAKPNTVTSLVRKGLVVSGDFSQSRWALEESFHAKLREGYSVVEYRTEDEVEDLRSLAASQGIPLTNEDAVEAIQNELNTNMWDEPVISEEERATFAAMVETFKGVGDGWYNTQVWDSLSLEEIQEDLKTATPVNRKARREQRRLVTRAWRKVKNNNQGTVRKQIKICGGKG